MLDAANTKFPSFSQAESLRPARRLVQKHRERQRAVTIAFASDLESQVSRPHAFSFIPGNDSLSYPSSEYEPDVRSWAVADSSGIPPPPNTPASHLIKRRQSILQAAHDRCFHSRVHPQVRELLENLPFRIDPSTKVIRSDSLINYGSAFKQPSHGGWVDDSQEPIRRLGPKRPSWLDLIPAKSRSATLALRSRVRNPKKDETMPRAILKRKLKDAARSDYLDQLDDVDTKRIRIEQIDNERESLRATCDSLNDPANHVIDIEIDVGETLEEKVKHELAARASKIKRLSKHAFKLTRESLTANTARKSVFTEPELLVTADQQSIKTEDFAVVPRRRAKIGSKIRDTVKKLQEKSKAVKNKVRDKVGSGWALKEIEQMEPLLAVHF